MSTSTSCFTKLLHKIDCIASVPIFRVNRQSSYKTKTGGIFTIVFAIMIIIILGFRIRSRQRGELMSYTKKQVFNNDVLTLPSGQQGSSTFIAIKVWDTDNIYYDSNYFTIIAYEATRNNFQEIQYKEHYLQPCKEKSLIGHFCLYGSNNWKIHGNYSGDFQQLQFSVKKCQGDRCGDQDYYWDWGKNFYVQIIYQNYFLNLDQQIDYKQKVSKKFVVQLLPGNIAYVNFELSKFTIETDRNYLVPFPEGSSIKEQGYYILEKPLIQNIRYSWGEQVIIYLRRSHLTTIIKRTDHNLIDIFSYVGGLATLILAIIQFLAYQYNSYAFEVQFSYKLFHEQQKHQSKNDNQNTDDRLKQQPQNKHSMATNSLPSINLFTFIKDMLPCFKKTARMKSYRLELKKQLDIQHLLRKINVFQNMLLLLLRRSNIILSPKEINKYRIKQAQEFRKTFQLPQYENSDKTTQRQDKKTDKLQERQYKGHLEIVLQSNFNLETPDQYKNSNKDIIQDNERVKEQQF